MVKNLLNKLSSKILIHVILFVIIPYTLIAYFISKPFENITEKRIADATQSSLSVVALYIENILDDMMDATTVLTTDKPVMDILKNNHDYNSYTNYIATDDLITKIEHGYLKRVNALITILDYHGNLYSNWEFGSMSYDELMQLEWIQNALSQNKLYNWIDTHESYARYENNNLISITKEIEDFNSDESYGLSIISIHENNLREIMSNYKRHYDDNVFIINKEGQILSHTNAVEIGKNILEQSNLSAFFQNNMGYMVTYLNGEKTIITYVNIDKTNWKLVETISYGYVFSEIRKVKIIMIGIIFMMFFIFIMITYVFSKNISEPIQNLSHEMGKIKDENLSALIKEDGPEEVVLLMRTYNKMIVRIKKLLVRVKEEEQQKEAMKFKALQAQINPHFIFNTLNNIKFMAYMCEANEVGQMISALGNIMEGSIGRGEDAITLDGEIKYVKDYIYLQKIRYNERVKVQYDIPQDLFRCKIIRFSIQPIVENAIYHGLESKKGNGLIQIQARSEGNTLIIVIQDNGVGMKEERLKEMRAKLKATDYDKINKSIGIKNIHDRIRINYGDEYGLTLYSKEYEGTMVELRLPIEEDREDDKGFDS